MSEPLHIAHRPCSTCPYDKATPAGIWDASEYRKLRRYDGDIKDISDLAIFMCHQQNATKIPTVCRGWLLVHPDHVAVRLGIAKGQLNPEKVYAPSTVTCYATGAEACAAGLKGIRKPSKAAKVAIGKLIRKGAGG